jgi:hypothetical protein
MSRWEVVKDQQFFVFLDEGSKQPIFFETNAEVDAVREEVRIPLSTEGPFSERLVVGLPRRGQTRVAVGESPTVASLPSSEANAGSKFPVGRPRRDRTGAPRRPWESTAGTAAGSYWLSDVLSPISYTRRLDRHRAHAKGDLAWALFPVTRDQGMVLLVSRISVSLQGACDFDLEG